MFRYYYKVRLKALVTQTCAISLYTAFQFLILSPKRAFISYPDIIVHKSSNCRIVV
jgi:hypothetical protein